ncbi:ABC transporter substrate-binding protein [Deinococcus yavapaiensis]|uniref:Carbohydrate ABC transporter substrate-binding protein (CUT1 family) n=1 Tax=Deinococcus yavapaiensis KR-236 TaxID=694435 RepID=A0A318SE23_9DEIO|nr:extracellular solute-binding protein [Deinococcus yavapaiensis]PYE51008.1 carbohydrate ABC transporter substrate-binding protein (CUT1 family) [Deinococcus yavapaiensis KR-236]
MTTRRLTTVTALLLAATATLASAQGKKTVVFLSGQNEDVGYTRIISELSQEYAKTHPTFAYQYQNNTTDMTQKLQLLAASKNLPTMYSIGEPAFLQQLASQGQAMDLEATFKKVGIYNQLNPVAVEINKKLQGGKLLGLPLELNIEGFWYNKKLFADNGLKEPKTWDELLAAAEVFKKKGIQPFSASGQQKWPLTRILGGYAARKYGADVMERVKAGTLKLTDAGFVEAARMLQDMGKKGYFGLGVNTIDYDTAVDTFLQGKAAMFYMGSWELRTFNDAKRNKIGAQNIGFFNTPTVKGGKGTLNDWSINTGLAVAVNQSQNDAALGEWMKFVFSNYANRAMSELGMLTGFKVTKTPANVPALTKMTQQKLDTAKKGYLWFEGYFSAKATAVSQDNVQLLVTGDMSPQDYLAQLQAALR